MAADGSDRLRLEFSPEAGANVPVILERLRRAVSDLPIENVNLGPVREPPPAEPGCELRSAIGDDEPAVITLKLPRCPQCRHAKHLRCDGGTPVNTEDEKRQYLVCHKCGKKVIALWA